VLSKGLSVVGDCQTATTILPPFLGVAEDAAWLDAGADDEAACDDDALDDGAWLEAGALDFDTAAEDDDDAEDCGAVVAGALPAHALNAIRKTTRETHSRNFFIWLNSSLEFNKLKWTV